MKSRKPVPNETTTTAARSARVEDVEPSDEPSVAAGRHLSILLAEDTPANQKLLARILSKRGHEVTIAANGRKAVERLADGPFDVILMDVQMPEMDGYQATAAIREIEQLAGAHTPIIALTANSAQSERQACLDAGMDDFLAKPIDVASLVSAVETAAVRPQRSPAQDPPPTRPNQQNAGATFDPQAAQKRLGGGEDLLREFVEVFLEETPKLLATLQTAIADADAAALGRTAHALGGLASNLCAENIAAAARELEAASDRAELRDADRLAKQLASEVSRFAAVLENFRRP
jgi:CheY-like chemotaxis protein